MENTLKTWFLSFLHLFFSRQCAVCGTPLQEGEEAICLKCNMNFFYHKGSDFRRILHQLKYGGRKDLGETMGRFMAAELTVSGFFHSVDVIVPIPLHPRKQRMRGYNQSECIAKGVAAVTGIPLDAASVVRKKHTETQTSKSAYERWKNVDGIFHLRYPERFVGKHILLVDDVLTTGATITTCADVFRDVEGVRISVLTLAVANF